MAENWDENIKAPIVIDIVSTAACVTVHVTGIRQNEGWLVWRRKAISDIQHIVSCKLSELSITICFFL